MTQTAQASGAAREGTRAPQGRLRGATNWFERLCAHLSRRRALKTAKTARAEAWIAYAEARRRGDTRAQNVAGRALRAATTAVVRLELGQ